MILAETVLPFHLAYSLNRPQRLEMLFVTHETVSRDAIPTTTGTPPKRWDSRDVLCRRGTCQPDVVS